MVKPAIRTGTIKTDNFQIGWQNCRKVTAFGTITKSASTCKVAEIMTTFMLLAYDMFNLMR